MITRYNKTSTKRALRTRSKIARNSTRPRLSVFRSNKFIYAQIIDDAKAVTLAAARGHDPKEVGAKIAALGLAAKIEAVVFDRGAYNYHGQVKLLAESARAAGLKF